MTKVTLKFAPPTSQFEQATRGRSCG